MSPPRIRAALAGEPLGERARDRRRRRRSPRRRARCRRGRCRSPRKPPRSSRKARRSTSGKAGRRGAALRRGGIGAVHGRRPQSAQTGRRSASIAARAQAHRAVAAAGEVEIVGDEHQGRAAVALEREEQVDDRLAGGLVEIAGRLVGHQDGRVRHDGAGDRDALLLAAGKLRRIMVQPMRRGRPPQARPSARSKASSRAGEFERQGDVLQRRHGRARDGRTGTRCRCAGRGTAPAHPRRGRRGRCRRRRRGRNPAAPARPWSSAASICPSPTGRRGPTASPRAIVERDPLQDMHPRGAAPEARSTSCSAMALSVHRPVTRSCA